MDALRDDKEDYSPRLVCNFKRDTDDHVDTFSSIHAAWGICIPLDDPNNRFSIEEDSDGFRGQSDLVVSLWVDSNILSSPKLEVSLALMFTPLAVSQYGPSLGESGRKTGPGLSLFTAGVNECDHVRVLRERPMGLSQPQRTPVYGSPTLEVPSNKIKHQLTTKINEEENSFFRSMETQLEATSESKKSMGNKVTVIQISPCTMKVSIGSTEHIVRYPYPVYGAEVKVNVDKQTKQVNLTAPLLNPIESGGYPADLFPLLHHGNYSPWNIHHILVDRMPKLSVCNSTKLQWLVDHIAFQMSDRERFVRHCTQPSKRHSSDVLVNIKERLATLVQIYAGLGQTSCSTFALREPSHGIYMLICIGGLRLDLAAATVLLDAAIIPYSSEIANLLDPKTPTYDIETRSGDVAAWNRFLAACVERGRTWSHGPSCEYKSTGNAPLSIRVEDNPLCSCGRGAGFGSPDWKVAGWERLLPYGTRAAISPLFGVSYVESIMGPGMKQQDTKRPISWDESTNKLQEGKVLFKGLPEEAQRGGA
ncbi:hypothetical protein FRC07_001602 [Ceratobasidium sp. 392]|nr:hypothetical protein FRC07_001602 [Ceratobasidium sp. 392]